MKYIHRVTKLTILTLILSCNDTSYFKKGLKQFRKGNFEQAIEILNKEIEINSNNADAYYERGNAKNQLEDFYGALEDYNKAINIERHPAYLNNRSFVNSKVGNFKNAIKDATEAINKKLDFSMAYMNRAIAYSMLNENNQAIEDFTEVLRLDDNNITALVSRAIIYQKINRLDLACKDWDIASNLGVEQAKYSHKTYCE
jgi:tetratricopeptide (TPR) repeat protein